MGYVRHPEPDPARVAGLALVVAGAVGLAATLPAVGLILGWW